MSTSTPTVVTPTPNNWCELKVESWTGNGCSHLEYSVDGAPFTIHNVVPEDTSTSEHAEYVSNRLDSVEFSAIGHEFDEERGYQIPQHLICLLSLTIQDTRGDVKQSPKTRYVYTIPIRTQWYDGSAYTYMSNIVQQFVDTLRPREHRSYMEACRARLLEWSATTFVEADFCAVESSTQWEREVTRMIASYCSSVASSPFCVEIDYEYVHFPVPIDPGTSYIESIGQALDKTALRNLNGDIFWSKKVIDHLFDQSTVQRMVESYFVADSSNLRPSTPRPNKKQRTKFVEWLLDDRVCLLGTAVRCEVELYCLYQLMEKKRDINDPYIPLEEDDLKLFLGPGQRWNYGITQKGFRPMNFPPLGHPKDLTDDNMGHMPIFLDWTKDLLGKGNFGMVYRAQIHPEYHAFSQDKGKAFALKVVSTNSRSTPAAEMRAWDYLAKHPHDHLTTLYASWSEKDRFYMLSPLAQGNLHDHMSNRKFAFETDTRWLLKQLEGLARAIQLIHNIGRAGLDNRTDKFETARRETIESGYHNDLKPRNILVFKNEDGEEVLKICDFGAVGLRATDSSTPHVKSPESSQLPGGNFEYGAPDHQTGYGVGRPHDIWSFACILLEVLLWAFGQSIADLQDFQNARVSNRRARCEHERSLPQSSASKSNTTIGYNDKSPQQVRNYPNFWYFCPNCRCPHLKPVVKEKLRWLKKEANDRKAQIDNPCKLVEPLFEVIEEMFEIEAKYRPRASYIVDTLGHLRVKAQDYADHRRPGNERPISRISEDTGSQARPRSDSNGGFSRVASRESHSSNLDSWVSSTEDDAVLRSVTESNGSSRESDTSDSQADI